MVFMTGKQSVAAEKASRPSALMAHIPDAAALLAQGGFQLAWLGTGAVVMLVVAWSVTYGMRLQTEPISTEEEGALR